MLAPLPRCSTTVRPFAATRVELRQHRGDVLVGQAVEAVAAHALVVQRLGSANICASSGCARWNAVSKQATCGRSGRRSSSRRIGVRLCGWCSGASGTNCCQIVQHLGVDAHRLRVLRARRARRGARCPAGRGPAACRAGRPRCARARRRGRARVPSAQAWRRDRLAAGVLRDEARRGVDGPRPGRAPSARDRRRLARTART